MAISATVVTSQVTRRKMVEREFTIAISSGGGSMIVNLDTTFENSPQMLVVTPLGSDGTYTPVYDSATPKITVTVTTETVLDDLTVPVVLIAVDKTDVTP